MSDHSMKSSLSKVEPQALSVPASKTAVVFAAHGERGGAMQNASLAAHVGGLTSDRVYQFVGGGVLNGTPNIQSALAAAKESGAERILVYPLFMASGYFVDERIPKELQQADCAEIGEVLTPLGSDPGLPAIMLARAVRMARKDNLSPASARLLVVGHGSKSGAPASARATRQFAAQLRGAGVFNEVDVALLEEAPFVSDVLTTSSRPTVVIGYFYAAGLHAAEDVPEAIKKAGADAIYIGAIGADIETTHLIRRSIHRAIITPVSSNANASDQTVIRPLRSPKVSFFARLKCFVGGLLSRRTA